MFYAVERNFDRVQKSLSLALEEGCSDIPDEDSGQYNAANGVTVFCLV